MIHIHLKHLGNTTEASCSIFDPVTGREETHGCTESTGAKALTAIVEALTKTRAGEEWECITDPTLRGVVPGKRYRKSPGAARKARKAQTRMFA